MWGYLKRWPEIKFLRRTALEVARAIAASVENIKNYFDELE